MIKNVSRLTLGLLSLLSLFSLPAASVYSQTTGIAAQQTDTYLQDLSYGTDARQKLDIALAANRNSSTPLVILIHGGGWTRGDKRDLSNFLGIFTSKGFNVANINYRLAGGSDDSIRWPDLIEDVRNAIGYIRTHADEWQIKKEKYILWGASSGAHLAFLYGYQFDSASVVSSVIGFGTPSRLNDPVWNEDRYKQLAMLAMPALTGQSWNSDTSNPALIRASPYYSKSFKPSLLIHGDRDNTVPYSQSVQLYDLLQSKGIDSKLILLKNGGHYGQGTSFENIQAAVNSCVEWINKYGS
jgi:acetyl esterase/lipase